MGFESADTRRLRGKAANAAKLKRANAEELRGAYAAARIADYARKVVAISPPLTDDQCDYIAGCLRKA